jgi:hypothetical protein
MDGLRTTDTNSANDNKGRAFGLEGNDFIYVLVAFVVALGLYLLLTVAVHATKLAALVFVSPIFLAPVAWVLFLRHNKPEGYAEDWFDQTFNGEGWSFVVQAQPQPFRSPDHDRRT